MYDEDKDVEGKKRRQARRKQRDEKVKKGGRDAGSASDYSYRSAVSVNLPKENEIGYQLYILYYFCFNLHSACYCN